MADDLAGDADEGGYKTYPNDDFLDAICGEDFVETSTVAEKVGCTPRTAQLRLKELEEAGEVKSQMVGRSKIWVRAGDGS